MITAPGITVNGINITTENINTEVQYHPAESLPEAKYEAMKALVVRELLIQRAVELHICEHASDIKETDDILEKLFDKEIIIPEVTEEVCKIFYDNNNQRFYSSPLFEVSHILYPAPPNDKNLREVSFIKAKEALARINKKPKSFEAIARSESACSSAKIGGHLGQITKGQTTPVFEKALFNMKEGEVSSEPLASEFGYHIIKVYKRLEGKQLPFEAVQEWISDYIRRQSWKTSFNQYVQLLAGKAKISGFQLKQETSPLVQ